MNKKQLFIAAALIVATIGFFACKKDNTKSTLEVRLTDNPALYEEVNVDIKEVRVKLSEESSDNEWITLTTHAGIYDLLTLQLGVDTAIATGELPSGTVRQIRLILGPNNTIKYNGVLYQLEIPSGAESGLKIMVNKKLEETRETMVIDFDAALSVRQETNGEYKLRPVIKEK